MKELFDRIKMDVVIAALACIVLGVVLIFWPAETMTVACKAMGGAIAFLGALRLFGYLKERENGHMLNLLLGLMLLVVGVWIFLQPQSIQQLLMIGIGVVLFVHGVEDLKYALYAKRGGYDSWAMLLLLAVLCMGFGAVCVVNCFGVISIAMWLVGAALIYDGVTDLWIISRVMKVDNEVRRRTEGEPAKEADEKTLLAEESGAREDEAHGV